MPPKRSPICKFEGCVAHRHIYPSGSWSQYCKKHMRYRKAKQRGDLASMTGPMMDILHYLREQKRQGSPFVVLEYPLAHGATIAGLIERDWIFASPGLDGIRYKITGRGLNALKAYEIPAQRTDGICPRCGERERHVNASGRQIAYCLECERARGRHKNDQQRNRPGVCKKCHVNPKRQYSSGKYSDYCLNCDHIRSRNKDRKANQKLLDDIRSGAAPPLCVRCKTAPVRVFANSVSSWCAECGRVETRKSKLRRMFRESGLKKASGE